MDVGRINTPLQTDIRVDYLICFCKVKKIYEASCVLRLLLAMKERLGGAKPKTFFV